MSSREPPPPPPHRRLLREYGAASQAGNTGLGDPENSEVAWP